MVGGGHRTVDYPIFSSIRTSPYSETLFAIELLAGQLQKSSHPTGYFVMCPQRENHGREINNPGPEFFQMGGP